ncbi:MAG: hypothetical protein ABIX10_13605 [Acidimicrobiales bacterium]
MKAVIRPGLKVLHKVAGQNSALERRLRRRYRRIRSQRVVHREDGTFREMAGEDFVYGASIEPGGRVGIYLRGGCDLPATFRCLALLKPALRGEVCIYKEGNGISDARVDLLLQGLRGVPSDQTAEVVDRLQLGSGYFGDDLFSPTFRVPAAPGIGEFRKDFVILSMGPNLVRTAYRHREHGFLVDPGGWWLNQSMDKVLGNLDTAKWFNSTFQSIGKMSVDQFSRDMAQLVTEIRDRTGAQILVFNVLDLEPGNLTHNHRFITNQHLRRLREFPAALADLSHQLGFAVVDVDQVVKGEGAGNHIDFAHFPSELADPVAREVCRALSSLGLDTLGCDPSPLGAGGG